MSLKDTQKSYGEISLLNHWVVVTFIVALLTLGLVYDALPRSDARETIINWHASLGLLAIPFIIWRIVWRVKSGFPQDTEQSRLAIMIKRTVHILLLLAIGLLIISGPMYLWTEAEPLPFFGLFEIPSPFAEESEWLHEAVEIIHKYVANPLLIILIALHFLAALKGIFWDKRKIFIQEQ